MVILPFLVKFHKPCAPIVIARLRLMLASSNATYTMMLYLARSCPIFKSFEDILLVQMTFRLGGGTLGYETWV